MRKKVQLVNIYLFSQHESQGREVETQKINDKIVAAQSKCPIKKLYEAGTISEKLHKAGTQYQADYATSSLTNHARPYWGETPRSTNTESTKDFSDIHSDATRRAEKVIERLNKWESEWEKYQILRGKKPRKKHLIQITQKIFQQQLSINHTSIFLKTNFNEIQDRIIKILTLMQECYEKPKPANNLE